MLFSFIRPKPQKPHKFVRTITKQKPKIGLALGSGTARGWSHIGIINALVLSRKVFDRKGETWNRSRDCMWYFNRILGCGCICHWTTQNIGEVSEST